MAKLYTPKEVVDTDTKNLDIDVCPNCGHHIDGMYCPNCGTKLKN